MRKKVLLILTVLIVILTTTVMATNVLPDTDSRVITLKQNGVLIGDENGNLNLNQSLKRQEMVVLISRLMGKEQEAKNWDTSSLTFLDVKKDDWAAGYIAWAKDNSITKGYSDEWFGYDDGLTTTQTQIFLLRVLGNLEAEMYNANDLSNKIGIMKDITNGNQEQIIRSDVAIMLYNTLEVEKNTKQENVFYNASNSIMNLIDEAYEEYQNTSKIVANKGKAKYSLKLNTQMTDEYKEAEKLNGMEATISSEVDIKKEILKMALNLKQNTNEFVDGEIIIDSENLYFKIKDIIDKYVYDSMGENIFAEYASETVTDDESLVLIKDIYDNVKLDIIDILSKEEIVTKEEKTVINGKEVFVTKNSIKMNTKLTDKLMLVIYKELLNNNDFINYMVETTNAQYESWGEWGEQFKITAKELKSEIQNEINSINSRIKQNQYKDDETIVLNIYTTGLLNKPVKYEVADKYNEKYSLVLFEDNIEFTYQDIYFDNSVEEISIRLNKKEDNKWYFEFAVNEYENSTINNQLLLAANITKLNNLLTDITYNFNLITDKEEIYKADGSIALSVNTVSEKYMNLSGIFTLNRNGNILSTKFEYEVDEDAKLDDNYKDNAIYYGDIDEAEWNEIQEKIENIGLKFTPYTDAFESLAEAMFGYKNDVVDRANEAVFKNDMRTYQEILVIMKMENYLNELEGEKVIDLNGTTAKEIQEILPEFNEKYEGIIIVVDGVIKKGEKAYQNEQYNQWLNDIGIQ